MTDLANRIARITIEIGGDTTKLSTALKSVNTEIYSTQQLRDVNSLLKLDPAIRNFCAETYKSVKAWLLCQMMSL